MKKIIFLMTAFALSVSACLPAAFQQPEATIPSAPDLNATASILSQQTLNALPTVTLEPSNTPVIKSPTKTSTQAIATETQNSILLTLTATLGTGTVIVTAGKPTVTITGTLPSTTPSATPNSNYLTPTETPHLQYSGTMPPNLPFGKIRLINKSKTNVYISMRCVTKDGYVTIIEYPVDSSVNAKGPAGRYSYVVWVGGRKIIGSFSLSRNQDLSIIIYKDRVAIK